MMNSTNNKLLEAIGNMSCNTYTFESVSVRLFLVTFVDFIGIGSSCFVRTVLNKLTCHTASHFDVKSNFFGVLIRWKLRLVFGRKTIDNNK